MYQNITQKVRCDLYANTWSALYAIQNFLKYFLAIDFYAVSFHTIISLIAFHASSVALLMLSPFFHVLTHFWFSYHLSATLIGCWWGCSRGKQGYLKTVTAVMTSMVFNFLLWDCNEWIMFWKILSCFSCQKWGCDLYPHVTYTRINTVITLTQ